MTPDHKCHQHVIKWNDPKTYEPRAMCSVCKRVIVVVRKVSWATDDKPMRKHYPRWAVFYPSKRADIMLNFFSAMAHANYVSRSPQVMQPQE